jgi:hypothetical protein
MPIHGCEECGKLELQAQVAGKAYHEMTEAADKNPNGRVLKADLTMLLELESLAVKRLQTHQQDCAVLLEGKRLFINSRVVLH